MSERLIDDVLFNKFVEISERQASALATLALRQSRDDELLGRISNSQDTISRGQTEMMQVASRIAERLDHMDEEARLRTAAAVEQVKHSIASESSKVALSSVAGDKWTKILCALLGFIAAALTALVVVGANKSGP